MRPTPALPVRDWRQAEAENQARFRDMNESIEATTDALGLHEKTDVYVCECGDGECREPIRLTREEYESVRREGTHFAIVIDHENPEIDRVVEERERFAIVQKTLPVAVKIARQTNPRE
jgi:hypothetical protein